MKITIDISDLTKLANIEDEIEALDAELLDLIQAVQAGANESNEALASQLGKLIKRAAKQADNNSAQRLEMLIRRYAHGYSDEVYNKQITPHRRAILKRIDALKNHANEALSDRASSGHLTARRTLLQDYDEKIVRDIEKLVTEAIEKHLGKTLDAVQVTS